MESIDNIRRKKEKTPGENLNREMEREQQILEKVKKIQENGNNPEFIKAKETIDFDLLRYLYSIRAARCGIEGNRLNFIDRDMVFDNSRSYNLGDFHPLLKFITLNSSEIDGQSHDLNNPRLMYLFLLAHEEFHAISKNAKISFGENLGQPVEGFQLGYCMWMEDNHASSGLRFLNKDFNEGITSILALDIVSDYLKTYPGFASQEDRKKFVKKFDFQGVTLVNLIIAKLVQETGVSKETVKDTFLKGMLSGEMLSHPEIGRGLREIFHDEEFLRKLSSSIIDEQRLSDNLGYSYDRFKNQQSREFEEILGIEGVAMPENFLKIDEQKELLEKVKKGCSINELIAFERRERIATIFKVPGKEGRYIMQDEKINRLLDDGMIIPKDAEDIDPNTQIEVIGLA